MQSKKKEAHPVFLELEIQWKYQMFKEHPVFGGAVQAVECSVGEREGMFYI